MFLSGSQKIILSCLKKIKALIEDSDNKIYISIASLWEMAIKVSLGKLKLNKELSCIIKNIKENGINILSIDIPHVLEVINLPFFHRDPFDRLIIAQALIEELTIITADSVFSQYPVKCLW